MNPLTEENDKLTTVSFGMTTETNGSPAPRERIDPYSRYSFNDLLTCIREQQAALEKMLYDFDESDCEYDGDLAAVTNARAVLEKWRIE